MFDLDQESWDDAVLGLVREIIVEEMVKQNLEIEEEENMVPR